MAPGKSPNHFEEIQQLKRSWGEKLSKENKPTPAFAKPKKMPTLDVGSNRYQEHEKK
jgi:hypothetical protein